MRQYLAGMSHLYFLCISLLFVLFSGEVNSQKLWDGGAGNNLWNDPWNWTGNSLPTATDDVFLDNTLVSSNYSIVLPASAVTVRTITIRPLLNRNIELVLPSFNVQVPGFTANGPGYGMSIFAGGVFRNASGSGSGNAVNIRDSIRISNGGRYIHNTTGGHVNVVQVLSAAPGTEEGIFELNIPTASSTLSLSGRRFGRLVMRAQAAGGSCNYTAAGIGRVLIRSHLELDTGVNLSLNLSDTIFVRGDFEQNRGTFNLGTTTRSAVLHVQQNFTQEEGGIITETGTGIHSIVMGGTSGIQLMSVRGSWNNQVAFIKDGGGTVLMKTALSLPYHFALRQGKIVTSDEWVLTLQAGCTIQADTLNATSCISGPLRKEGLNNSSFLFPVGDLVRLRWVFLEQANGSFTVEYSNDNPRTISNNVGSGIHHISAVEYWTIDATGSSPSSRIRLSFFDPHSGGVTDMRWLRVARLINGVWQNAGNTMYSGSPGSNGWVSSSTAGGFTANSRTFALASATSQENPLPLIDLAFELQRKRQMLEWKWQVQETEADADFFELQQSANGKDFITLKIISAQKGKRIYEEKMIPERILPYYRLRLRKHNSDLWYESVIKTILDIQPSESYFTAPTVANGSLRIYGFMKMRENCTMTIRDMQGRVLIMNKINMEKGTNAVALNVSQLYRGVYLMQLFRSGKLSYTSKFFKQ